MEIITPVAEDETTQPEPSVRGTRMSIKGRTVAFVNNGQEGMPVIIDQMSKRLVEKAVGGIFEQRTPTSRSASPEVLDRIARDADFAIAGAAT